MYLLLLLLLLSLSLSSLLLLGDDDDDDDELIDFDDDHPKQHTIIVLSLSLSLSLCFVFNSLLSSAQITQQNTTKHLFTHTLSYCILCALIVIDDANVFSISSQKNESLLCVCVNLR